jgi:azurin
MSAANPGVVGHDVLAITRRVLVDSHRIFLEIPDVQPTNTLHLRMQVNDNDISTAHPTGQGHELFFTIHRLDDDFRDYPQYHSDLAKKISKHPLLQDMAFSAQQRKNPWSDKLSGESQKIEVEAGKNLSFAEGELTVAAGQQISLTLSNPDVVPHNWVLVQPGSLNEIGDLTNKLIADPDAFARQYVPDSPAVIVYTDVVPAGGKTTIHFTAPDKPGRYPYLCTFPGHWMAMNGTLVVLDQ